MSTAGIVVIGNEVLSGKVEEANASYLITRLRMLGVELKRVAIIEDEIDTIATEVAMQTAAFDHVFTSGGIGSTHDDVTYAAVAQAFGVEIKLNEDVLQLVKDRGGDPDDPTWQRMATLPEGSELVGGGPKTYPVVKIKNVYVFPGVPDFLRRKFEDIEERFRHAQPFVLAEIFLSVSERLVAEALRLEDARHPDVDIGSYPRFEEDAPHKTRLTLEGRDVDAVRAAYAGVMAFLEPDWIVSQRPPPV